MKTVRAKKPTPKSDDEKLQDDLDDIIKLAAIEGAELIRDMIGDDKFADASRLAAAKYAVERADSDNKQSDDNATIGFFMDLVRQIRTSKELASPEGQSNLLSGKSEPEKKEDDKDWSKWINSNVN